VSRTLRHGAMGSLLAAVALTATGCAAGFDAPTTQFNPPTNGAQGQTGDMRVRNVLLVTGPGPGPSGLLASFVTYAPDDDVLTGVRVEGAGPVAVEGGSLVIPRNTNVGLGEEVAGGVPAAVTDLTVQPGRLTSVTFTFRDAGIVTLKGVLVQLPSDVEAGS
jgi:hypothetical protein